MENKDKKLDRVERLQKLLDTHFNGKKDELGRFLGYKDGAFVRQMLSRNRPISEKTVDKINSIKKFKNWFDSDELNEGSSSDGMGFADVALAHHDPLIQSVIELMSSTDLEGKVLIKAAAFKTLNEYKFQQTALSKSVPSVMQINNMDISGLIDSERVFTEKEQK